MLTHKERILKLAAGEMVDKIPFVPRLDLWHNANTYRGTLAEAYKNMTADEIALANGWPLHKHVPEFLKFETPEDTDHGGLGFDIVDMGVNVDTAEFVRQVTEVKPDILGMSALLTTTMPQMQDAIDALVEAGLRDRIKIIVGGAPVNQKFADDIGADGYAADAGDAVELVRQLLPGNKY